MKLKELLYLGLIRTSVTYTSECITVGCVSPEITLKDQKINVKAS
jgi:hypothetical protein